MPHEDKILFAMNTIFRLKDVENCGSISIIHLTLSNNNEQNLTDLVSHFKKEIDEDQIPPVLMLGEFLWKMGDYGRADRYYRMMLKELSSDRKLIGKVCNNIGLIALEKGDFRVAMRYFQKALRFQQSTETLDLAETYSNIALLHDMREELEQAIHYNKKSLEIRLRLLPDNDKYIGLSYNNLGLTYFHCHDFPQALRYYEKARSIQSVSLGSSDHFDHATTLNNIGLVHFEQGQYEHALTFYKEALAISERSLPAQHPQFADIYNNFGSTLEKLGELDDALVMFQKALD
ncbi:unnamed protein product, partial [Rotaria sp. Silwood2]